MKEPCFLCGGPITDKQKIKATPVSSLSDGDGFVHYSRGVCAFYQRKKREGLVVIVKEMVLG